MTRKSERDYACIPKVSFVTNGLLSLEEIPSKPLERDSCAVRSAKADNSD